MRNSLSKLAQRFPASGIREMTNLATKYPNAIKLTAGEPNFDTPKFICDAAKKALDDGCTRYNSNHGLQELREAIALRYANYNNGYTYSNVMVTVGAMEAIMLSLHIIINPGDEVLLPDPGYPNYVGQVLLAGGIPIAVPTYEENDFKIRAEDIEVRVTPKTRLLFLNSPNNPHGSVIDIDELKKIADIAKRHDFMVLSDEVYNRVLFEGIKCSSIAEIPGMAQRTLVINSLSKIYAMTGWRIGWVLADETIIETMSYMQETLVSCVSTFSQRAATEALSDTRAEYALTEMLVEYSTKRKLMVDGLNSIPGVTCAKTQGSFYAFPSIKKLGISSREFAIGLVEKGGVAVVPGSAFGKQGEGYLRIVFTSSMERLEEAIARIKKYVVESI